MIFLIYQTSCQYVPEVRAKHQHRIALLGHAREQRQKNIVDYFVVHMAGFAAGARDITAIQILGVLETVCGVSYGV